MQTASEHSDMQLYAGGLSGYTIPSSCPACVARFGTKLRVWVMNLWSLNVDNCWLNYCLHDMQIEDPFTVENGLLGNTLKIKRQEVVRKYMDIIEETFAERRHNNNQACLWDQKLDTGVKKAAQCQAVSNNSWLCVWSSNKIFGHTCCLSRACAYTWKSVQSNPQPTPLENMHSSTHNSGGFAPVP